VIARAAALGLALAAGLGGTAFAGRLPTVDAGPAGVAPVHLDIPAATPALVCPGPETAVVPDGAVPVPAPGPFTVTAAAAATGAGTSAQSDAGDAAAVLGPLATRLGGTALAGAGDIRVLARAGDPRGPLRLTPSTSSAGDGAGAKRLAAVQVTLARTGDLRGVAAGQCGAATADAWLVGGATTPGRRARLLLANPTPAPAVVDVRLAGPEGPVDVPSGRGLVVAPGRVRALLLDAAAPGLGQFAVHVVARSGRVTPLLHDSWLRGAVPAGTDDVLPSAAPARHVVVPGVVVLPGGPARLRVAATGSDDAVVRYHLVGAAGDVQPPGPGVLTVPAGGAADVSLRWVRPGAYAVVLDADAPVVAAASLTTTGAPLGPLHTVSADLAWTTGTKPLTGDVSGAAPRPVDSRHSVVTNAPAAARLVLTGGSRAANVTLREVDTAGRPLRTLTIAVPAGRTVGATLAPATAAYVLRVPKRAPVHGALVVTVPDPAGLLVTALPLQPAVVAARVAPPAVADPALPGSATP
jgi:hypothetical protein